MNKLYSSLFLLSILAPLLIVVFATGGGANLALALTDQELQLLTGNGSSDLTFLKLVEKVVGIINTIVPFLLTIIVALIVWGGAGLAMAGGNVEKRSKARDRIVYGLIGAVIVIGFWGVVSIAVSVLDLSSTPVQIGLPPSGGDITLFDKIVVTLLDPLVTLIFAIAFLYFVYGIVEFVLKADSPEGRTTGRRHIIWGLIGFVVMFGVWGIIALIQDLVSL